MWTRLFRFWDRLRSSYWFVPSLMSAAAVGLAFAAVEADRLGKLDWTRRFEWIWAGGPEGAREVLSVIAGSMITVTGVTFSITIVALTLASSQFGPRLLRNFMRDTGNQVVLGSFVATYLYCLLVLRTIQTVDGRQFVPHLSVTGGIVMAVLSLGVLIYFIHHIAGSIQAELLIATVARELHDSIDTIFPEELGEPAAEEVTAEPRPAGEGFRVCAHRAGYLQAVNHDELMKVAERRELLLRIRRLPGDFVSERELLAEAWPAASLDRRTEERLRESFLLGRQRTQIQDVEYAVHQLVEIAVRALSPGINDPFTAMSCLDWLGSALGRLARRKIPSRLRRDRQGVVRVIADGPVFDDVANAAFNQIRQYGRRSVSVTLRLLDVLGGVADQVRRPEDRESVRRHADLTLADARRELDNSADLATIEERHRQVLRTLAEPDGS